MAINSMSQVQEHAKEDELRKLLNDFERVHEQIEAESSKLLEESGHSETRPPLMASAMSWVTTEMKMQLKGDSHQVAKIMMDGCNMGIQSIAECQNQYPDASEEAKSLAKRLVHEEERFMQELKSYL